MEEGSSLHSRHSSVESQARSQFLTSSDTATASYTSFPPSPRSALVDIPSPSSYPTASLEALRISSLSASASAFATPRSSTQSLPGLAGYDWEYTARKLQTIHDVNERANPEDGGDEDEVIGEDDEQSAATALNALRDTALGNPGAAMEVDQGE